MRQPFTVQSSSVCDCDPELDPAAGQLSGRPSGHEPPGITFGELARLFVDRRDVKFWQTEGPRHSYMYWVRAMLSEEVEPPPLVPRVVRTPQSAGEQLRFAWARRQVYGFLARAFEYPDDAFLADITTPAYVEALTVEFRQLAGNEDVSEGLAFWRRIARSGEPLVGKYGLSPLRQAYTRIVYDTDLPCIPPYESVYCNERHVMGKQAGAVADFYRAAGLGIEGNEMPDHIALECEFVAYLAGREVAAWEADEPEEARRIQATTSRFLRHHLLTWGGKFCADLQALAGEDFYQAVAHLGKGLFNDELIRLDEA